MNVYLDIGEILMLNVQFVITAHCPLIVQVIYFALSNIVVVLIHTSRGHLSVSFQVLIVPQRIPVQKIKPASMMVKVIKLVIVLVQRVS